MSILRRIRGSGSASSGSWVVCSSRLVSQDRTGRRPPMVCRLVMRRRPRAPSRFTTHDRHPTFRSAQALYHSIGFRQCGPFGSYTENGNSVFMSLRLSERSA